MIAEILRNAKYEQFSDGTIYGDMPGYRGVWANAATLEACRSELASSLWEWIMIHKAPKIRKYYRMAYDPAYADAVWEQRWSRTFAKKASQRAVEQMGSKALREFRQAVERGRADIAAGRVVTHEQMEAEMDGIDQDS